MSTAAIRRFMVAFSVARGRRPARRGREKAAGQAE
jgi:hypothetical protein